ncbi:hypothetical protein BMS3Abin04_01492 [bacterium BMS3Abin04]|nr:hypothetical protein BMS3Abin04_01492 [bacterium BMS3Abin04]
MLNQNYPNPFNPTTNISYSLVNSVKVTLKIYDVLGNLIQTLVNEQQSAGNHEINFSGTNLASGLYIYRIQAGSFTQQKKMILLK